MSENLLLHKARLLLKDRYENDNNLFFSAIKTCVQDELLACMEKIGILKYLVFQGGTCLQRVYNLPRLSEDLDFCYGNIRDFKSFQEKKTLLENSIRETLSQNFQIEMSNIEVKPQKKYTITNEQDNNVEKWEAKIVVSHRGEKQVIRIEMVNVPSYEHKECIAQSVNINSMPVLLNAESLNELFADKIIALSLRPYMKYRDIYDIGFLISRGCSLSQDLFMKKAKDYKRENEIVSCIDDKILKLNENEDLFMKECMHELSRFIPNKKLIEIDKGYYTFLLDTSIEQLKNARSLFAEADLDKNVSFTPFM